MFMMIVQDDNWGKIMQELENSSKYSSTKELARAIEPMLEEGLRYSHIFHLFSEYVHPVSTVLTCINGLSTLFILLKGVTREKYPFKLLNMLFIPSQMC